MHLAHFPMAVVFDMDGLLFDTEKLYQKAIAAAAAEGGHDLRSVSRQMIGRPIAQSRELLIRIYGPVFPVDDFFDSMFRHFDLLAAAHLPLKPGVVELLDALDTLELPSAIATSSAHNRVLDHLTAHNLDGRFQTVVGHGDYAASKPAPDSYLLAAKRLGVDPRSCLALEDSHNGVRSASSAGMMTVMVPDLIEPTEEIRSLYNFVARDLHEVRAVLLNAAENSSYLPSTISSSCVTIVTCKNGKDRQSFAFAGLCVANSRIAFSVSLVKKSRRGVGCRKNRQSYTHRALCRMW